MTDAIRTYLVQAAHLMGEMAASLSEPTARAAQMLTDALRSGRTIYVCGNGGSASQAQHIAGELVGRFRRDRPALPCVALSTDVSVLTAVANDYGFEQVFERQVEALVREGDVLWCLSTSGASANVVRAAALARKRKAKVLGMTGRDGGALAALSDVALCVPADSSAPVQEGHLALLHILCDLVEQAMSQGKG